MLPSDLSPGTLAKAMSSGPGLLGLATLEDSRRKGPFGLRRVFS